MWFLLWFILSVIILGATAWSTLILIKQKQAWKAFAKKNNLQYRTRDFFAPCEMDGMVDGFEVSFFSAEQQNPDARKNRQRTVLQINDPTFFVDGLACGTPEVKTFIDMLDTLTIQDVSHTQFKKSNIIRSRHKKAVASFLTEERVKIINSLLAFPKSDNLILMDDQQGTFRFETSNPLTSDELIQGTLDKIFARIKKLRPSPEEQADFKRLRALDQKDTPTLAASAPTVEEEAVVPTPTEGDDGDAKPE